MEEDEILAHFRDTNALLEGHFVLSSGKHSSAYLQCALVLAHPDRAEVLCRALAAKLLETIDEPPDLVVSPAMGGVIVGYETGRQLGVPAIFTERVDGEFAFRRGFGLEPGARVVMVEDVVTTGLSSRECIRAIGRTGANTLAAACLVDRSAGAADVGVPLVSLLTLDLPLYDADLVPPELAAIPAEKPGSRALR